MVDPLSITAGVLTVLGACSISVKALKSAYTAPQELARLEIELSHLEDVVREIELTTADDGGTSHGLIKIISRARVKVQQVHDFMQNKLYHASSVSAKIKRRSLIR
jgi:hypothetical protein